jgi:hypothetical protein
MNKSLHERVEESGIVRAEVVIRKSRSPRDQIWVLTVDECPYCGKRHEHGGGSVDLPPLLGSRVPHCITRPAPRDYELVERAPKEQKRDQ